MNDILVSVIIPVFNCESKIENCVRSILDQTYSQLEVIIVDDASTDSSLQKCRIFNDGRITFISKGYNSGVPDTRNIGLEASKVLMLHS